MLIDLVTNMFGILKKHGDGARALASDSIAQYASSTRSEPITMIDHTIIGLPELTDLMKALTSVYAAMYTQAFSIAVNQEIGGIKVLRTLEQLNPNRSKLEAALSLAGSFESYSMRLPDFSNPKPLARPSISLENVNPANLGDSNIYHATDSVITGRFDIAEKHNKVSNDNDLDAITKFSSGLSTGVLFEVAVEADGRSVKIPVSIRLLANEIAARNILDLLSAAVKNMTAKERYREWRAGGLSFWKDIILCKDILREHRKNMIQDETGMFTEIMRRRNNNQMSGLMSGNPSISQISNVLIVSKETLIDFERDTGKKIKDQKTRDLIFKNTQVLIFVVVDRDREVATFYYHDLNTPTTVTFRDLKSAGKPGNTDTMEILKAYQMGNGIRF